jgi:hypothetical protein
MGRTGRPHHSPCHQLHLISDSDPYATRAADGRGGYATTYLGIAGRGTLWVPRAAGGPMELLVDALLLRRIRPF